MWKLLVPHRIIFTSLSKVIAEAESVESKHSAAENCETAAAEKAASAADQPKTALQIKNEQFQETIQYNMFNISIVEDANAKIQP